MTSSMNTNCPEIQYTPDPSAYAGDTAFEATVADVDCSQYGQLVRHCVDQTKETLCNAVDVSSDMKNASSILPQSSHALRSEIIRNANDMSTEEKLAATYENDDYEVHRLDEMNQMANDVRDNKAKNSALLYLAIAAPFVIVFAIPGSRKMIVSGAKRLLHLAA